MNRRPLPPRRANGRFRSTGRRASIPTPAPADRCGRCGARTRVTPLAGATITVYDCACYAAEAAEPAEAGFPDEYWGWS